MSTILINTVIRIMSSELHSNAQKAQNCHVVPYWLIRLCIIGYSSLKDLYNLFRIPAPPNADPTSPWKIPVTVVVIAAVCAGVVGVGVIVYRQHSRL